MWVIYNTQACDREHESDITTNFRARNIHKRRVAYFDDTDATSRIGRAFLLAYRANNLKNVSPHAIQASWSGIFDMRMLYTIILCNSSIH